MAIRIGSLLIRLAVEHGILEEGLARSEREVAKTTRAIQRRGQEIANFGKQMSLAVTLPILGIAAASIKAAQESADAIGQVEASLASMGNQAGRTSEQLQALAKSQMGQSLYDDDQILRDVTANLLTFGKISGEEFDRAQQAVLDMATKTKKDLLPVTIAVGKALQDPVKGVNALKKAGIDFSDAQKAMIASLVESGDVAGAQRIILTELEDQYEKSAKKAREADPGAALTQSFAAFQEEVGAKLLPLLPAISAAIIGVLDAFGSLPPELQTAVIVVGGFAAVLGPVIAGLGTLISAGAGTIAMFVGLKAAFDIGGLLKNLIPIIINIGRALLALVVSNPLLAALALAIGAVVLIWQNWDQIKPIIDRVVAALTEFWNTNVKPILDGVIAKIEAVVAIFRDLFAAQISTALNLVSALLRGDFAGAWEAMKTLVSNAVKAAVAILQTLAPGAIASVRRMYEGVKTWLQDKLGAVFKWVGDKVREVTGFFFEMYDAVVGNSYVPDMVDGIAAEFARLDSLMVDPARKATASVTEATRQMAADVKSLLDRLFPEIAAARQQAEQLDLLRSAQEGGVISGRTRSSAVNRLLGPASTSFDTNPEGPLVDVKKQLEEMNAAFEQGAQKTEVQTVRIARTVEDMAKDISGSLRGLVDGIKSGDFFSIFDGVLGLFSSLGNAGVFGGGVQSFLSGIPGNANGTAFHPGGLMQVGERGPEILQVPRGGRVIPNHELRAASAEARVRVMVGIDPRNGNITSYVDNRIGQAAPAVADLGAQQAQSRAARSARRRVR